MALFISLYRKHKTLDSTVWQQLRETGVPAATDSERLPPAVSELAGDPVLPVAGKKPREVAGV